MAIRLHSSSGSGTTCVPNEFIDYYMPSSNGEFVKIYLYLLRCLEHGDRDLSVSALADLFNNTEKDICRALKYWEKQGLLVLEAGPDRTITGICMKTPSVPASVPAAVPEAESSAPAPSPASARSTGRKTLSRERLEELQQQENIQQLLFIVEQYLGRTLGSTPINTILYIYDELHFSSELIEYLVEYCVSRGSKSIRYIETVALAWHEEHITTVEQAQEITSQYNKYVFSVLKSFGIKGRNPVASELAYIKKWTSEYGFTIEIITQACEKTMLQIHQPSFEYADKILSSWKKQGVKHPSDIQKLDESYQQSRKPAAPKASDTRNKFNNFDQRTYDFKDLERRLLNIQ